MINQLDRLADVTPSMSIAFSEILRGPFHLSNHLWAQRTGARGLFAPGSDLNNNYRFYLSDAHQSYGFVWDAPRPISHFSNDRMNLYMEGANLRLGLPSNIWFSGKYAMDGSLPVYKINNLYRDSEIRGLTIVQSSGEGSSFNVVVAEPFDTGHDVKTEFTLTFYRKGLSFIEVLTTKLDSSLVRKVGSNYTIAVGQLPIEAKFIKATFFGKRTIKVSLSITRQFAGRSATVNIEKEHVFKK